jgi:hypothetical protein
MTPDPFLKRWKPMAGMAFSLVALGIILFLGALFFLYVSQNYSYLVDRNFRLLATWSQELTATLENYERSFRFRIQEDESAPVSPSDSRIRSRSAQPALRNEGLIIEGLRPLSETDTQTRQRPEIKMNADDLARQTQKVLSRLPFVKNVQHHTSLPASLKMDPPADDQPAWVRFVLPSEGQPGTIQAIAKGATGALTASVSLSDLTQHIAAEPVFDDVLLATPSGTIVYQRNPSTLRFLHLNNLLHHQRRDTGWLSDIFHDAGLEQGQLFDTKNPMIQWATPSHFQMTVGGTRYDVFIQAVALPVMTMDKEQDQYLTWFLCGILPSSDFQEQYLAIPFTVLLFCLFLLIAALLALPLISLYMMNPRERLTNFSVRTLWFANLLGFGIGTLFFLDWGFYRETVSDFHDRLEVTAESIAEAFHTELDRMIWQLARYDREIQDLGDLEFFPSTKESKAWLARVNLPDPCLDSDTRLLPLCYPNFTLAFWVDRQGMLRETWTTDPDPYVRGIHDLQNRAYVAKLQDPSRPLFRRLINGQWFRFYAQPLISLESSTRNLVVSMPHQGALTPQSDHWIAAIQTEDIALLQQPVLPPETGYAVIENDTGLTLFHSNDRRMLRENFLEETDKNPELLSLIHTRAKGTVEGNYWGIGHRFAVMPLSGLPWTLVVFESKEAFRTINFEVLIFSLSLFALYILGLLLWGKALSLIYRSDASGRRIRWTWPKPECRTTYHRLTLLQGLVFLLGLLGVLSLDWQPDIALSSRLLFILLPFLVLAITVRALYKCSIRFRADRPDHAPDSWDRLEPSKLHRTFVGFGLSTFILLGVFPAIVFFKVAHDQEMRVFAQYQLWGLAQSLNSQSLQRSWLAKGAGTDRKNFQFFTAPTTCLIPGCKGERNPSPEMPPATCSPSWLLAKPDLPYTLHGILTTVPLPICLSFSPEPRITGHSLQPSWLDAVHRLVRKSSLHNPTNQDSWGFLHPMPQDATGEWFGKVADGFQRVVLRLTDVPQGAPEGPAFTTLSLSLGFPLFPMDLSKNLAALLLLALILLGFSARLLRYMAAKIFLLPSWFHGSPEAGSSPSPYHSASVPYLLIVGLPGSGKTQVVRSLGVEPSCHVLDLHETEGTEAWSAAMLEKIPETVSAVIVDHFEYRWEDPTHRKERGALLERLLGRGFKVALVSTHDPLADSKSPRLESEGILQGPERNYWVGLMGSFVWSSFHFTQMETMLRTWLESPAPLPSSTGTGSLLPIKHTLQRESQPAIHLERIGYWIKALQPWVTWTPSQIQEQFLHMGWPYYQALWQSCSLSEQLSLYHLAVDGYLHTDNPDLTSLAQKRLIRLEPDLQLMNESFRQCVVHMGERLQFSKFDTQTGPDTWRRLKWPFLLVFGIILVFFFFTQQEFKNSFMALVSLLPILLPALPEISFLSSARKPGGSTLP